MGGLHIPEKIGVMILPECSLFPHGALPLRIFEDRYKEMLNDALEGDPLIAISSYLGESTGISEMDASPVGTVGLVRACVRDDDLGGQLILHGVVRVKFVKWLEEKSYHYALIEPILNTPLSENSDAEERLRDAVEAHVERMPEEIGALFSSFLDKCDDPHILADLVGHHLIQNPEDRQRVLEIEKTEDRLDYLEVLVSELDSPEF